MDTVLVFHPRYLDHDPGRSHPERRERLLATLKVLQPLGLPTLEPGPAQRRQVLHCHTERYVGYLEDLNKTGGIIDSDTHFNPGTLDIALLSAGGAIALGDAVMGGRAENGFALLRPPGHHSGRDFGGGFCTLNNAAVLMEHLRGKYGLKRFLVIDWDVHHGNGTQDIYYEDPSVLYTSTHQWPLYPGTGRMEETGYGPGLGHTLNFPLPPDSTGGDMLHVLQNGFLPVAGEFDPQAVIVSAGYDAYFLDPLASLRFCVETYSEATRMLRDFARLHCHGRLMMLLEGGYHLDGLSRGIEATIEALRGHNRAVEPHKPPEQHVGVQGQMKEFKRQVGPHWDVF
ncbi:MAG: histone deacetylase [Euryarchaeota archaeon]|nr:histone deacetylase [Euryarchaeota archaeon]